MLKFFQTIGVDSCETRPRSTPKFILGSNMNFDFGLRSNYGQLKVITDHDENKIHIGVKYEFMRFSLVGSANSCRTLSLQLTLREL